MSIRTSRSGTARSSSPRKIVLTLGLVLGTAAAASGDSFRVKTDRGTFLVEVNDPAVTVRGERDELVVARAGGDEIRFRLDSNPEPTGQVSPEPVLTVRRDGKVIVSARRPGARPVAPPTAAGPGRTVLRSKGQSSAWSLAITPDARTLLCAHWGHYRVWDLATLTERLDVPTKTTVRRVAVSADGGTIATAEYQDVAKRTVGSIVIRDSKTGAPRQALDPIDGLHCVALAPDGKVAVSSTWIDGKMHVWDVTKGERVGTLEGHTGPVGTVVFSPDGKTLASGGDTTVRLWDVDTGLTRTTLRGPQGNVESVAFSGDGKTLAAGGFDNKARVWDVATRQQLALLEADDPILAVALTADGKLVATAAARWGNGFYQPSAALVRVWDAATGKPVATFPEQPNQIFALVFTPDGKSLVTGCLSGEVTVWDVAQFAVPAKPAANSQP